MPIYVSCCLLDASDESLREDIVGGVNNILCIDKSALFKALYLKLSI